MRLIFDKPKANREPRKKKINENERNLSMVNRKFKCKIFNITIL